MKKSKKLAAGSSEFNGARHPLPPIRIGVDEAQRAKLGDGLAVLLANSYMLYIKTQNFHWNVTGPFFLSLHSAFEAQYKDLALAADALAERIRSLGFYAVASCTQFKRLSTIEESLGIPSAADMVQELIRGHEAVIRGARNLANLADRARDYGTADLVTGRLEVHEKAAWMLRSLFQPETARA